MRMDTWTQSVVLTADSIYILSAVDTLCPCLYTIITIFRNLLGVELCKNKILFRYSVYYAEALYGLPHIRFDFADPASSSRPSRLERERNVCHPLPQTNMPRGKKQMQPRLESLKCLKKTERMSSKAAKRLEDSLRRHYERVGIQIAGEVRAEKKQAKKTYKKKGWVVPKLRAVVRTRYLTVRKMHKRMAACNDKGKKKNIEKLIHLTLQEHRADPLKKPGEEEWRACAKYFQRAGFNY